MRKLLRAAVAGLLTVVLGGAGLVAASPASAAEYYIVKIHHRGGFYADFCLHSQSYDNPNDQDAVCSGDQAMDWDYNLAVRVTPRHRAWLDVWVRAGASATQITLHNGYQERLGRHVFNTSDCWIWGATLTWWLTCDGEVFYTR